MTFLVVVMISQAESIARTATVNDAIHMVRIQPYTATDGSVASISPDRRKAAIVTWYGDLERDTNIYQLRVFDLSPSNLGRSQSNIVASISFNGDHNDQLASGISQVRFHQDNRTISFIGRSGDDPAQVFSVDTETGNVRRITNERLPVRSFITGPQGNILMLSLAAEIGEIPDQSARWKRDGVFLWDRTMFPQQAYFSGAEAVASASKQALARQYFLGDSRSRLIFDSRRSRLAAPIDDPDPYADELLDELVGDRDLGHFGTLTADPKGRHALLYPYSLTENRIDHNAYAYFAGGRAAPLTIYDKAWASPYGLVDLATGDVTQLLDGLHVIFDPGSAPPLWTPDGASVLVYTLLANAKDARPQWVKLELATSEITPLPVPPGWAVVSFAGDGGQIILRNGSRFASMQLRPNGVWGDFRELGAVEGFQSAWPISTNGEVVIGVVSSPDHAPEIGVYDLTSGEMSIISELNPYLAELQLGDVEMFRWESPTPDRAFGLLIKPVGFKPGRRYPLVILQSRTALAKETPHLFDTAYQLSGNAAQMLSAQGIMVLFPREATKRELFETNLEGTTMGEHLGQAIEALDRAGLIDPTRVAISGWSRDAYWANSMLIHNKTRFAAASLVDGGGIEYHGGPAINNAARPYTDNELSRICTPILAETHGAGGVFGRFVALSDRLTAMRKPIDIIHFPYAPHDTVQPLHRWRSLTTHIDWWRFWLQGYEDPKPEKASQYATWRELRELHLATKEQCHSDAGR